jgi:ubiquitin-protein ligase
LFDKIIFFYAIYSRMSADSLAPQIVSRLMKEIRTLVKGQKGGEPEIEYIESDDNSISEVQCYIYGPADTPYYGGEVLINFCR